MKKLIAITLCAVMALSLAACSKDTQSKNDQVQIPNPFVEYTTVEEAQNAAGFEVRVPENVPEGFEMDAIFAIDDKLVEINYKNGENKIRYRAAKGSEDISGDYNIEYGEINTITVSGTEVLMKGNNGKVNVATWTNGDYAFAICINTDSEGLEASAVTDMIESVL